MLTGLTYTTFHVKPISLQLPLTYFSFIPRTIPARRMYVTNAITEKNIIKIKGNQYKEFETHNSILFLTCHPTNHLSNWILFKSKFLLQNSWSQLQGKVAYVCLFCSYSIILMEKGTCFNGNPLPKDLKLEFTIIS